MRLRATLLSDGSSDRALLPILRWLLTERHAADRPVAATWADLRALSPSPRELHERIERALAIYPCDLLFVHRDAESAAPSVRRQEIDRAARRVGRDLPLLVKVIPVRMQETWLLIDEQAIRRAAGNPNGTINLELPAVRDLEAVSAPKELLYRLPREASGLRGRRLRRFRPERRALRVSELIRDFSPLLELPAFRSLDAEVSGSLAV